jgi:hypothetical protein
VLARPASAHTLTGVQPTNYRSEIVSVLPAFAGVSVDVLDLGRRIRLANHGPTDIVVYGYDGEPYLRVGRRGVFENVHSPAVYLNRPAPVYATTSTTLPRAADATAPPQWRRISRSATATWRDRRTRWEGPNPPSVKQAPGERQAVRPWLITLSKGATRGAITGRLVWVPGPSPAPWLVLAAVLCALTFAAVFTRRWSTLLAAALGVLVVNDIVHSFGAAAAAHDALTHRLSTVLVGGFYGTIAWVIGGLGIRPLRQGRDLGALLAGITGFFLALIGGATDFNSLARSQLAFVLPAGVARFEVALSLGMGAGLAAAAAWLFFGSGDVLDRHKPDTQSPGAQR